MIIVFAQMDMPHLFFEYTLPDSEIVLLPQLPTTTTQTTTTTTITSPSDQSYAEQQTTTLTNKPSTISTTTIPVVKNRLKYSLPVVFALLYYFCSSVSLLPIRYHC